MMGGGRGAARRRPTTREHGVSAEVFVLRGSGLEAVIQAGRGLAVVLEA
jgi:hypothetical protein